MIGECNIAHLIGAKTKKELKKGKAKLKIYLSTTMQTTNILRYLCIR